MVEGVAAIVESILLKNAFAYGVRHSNHYVFSNII
jgi:hypothetical protein